jgi:hypothetical protein
MWKWFRAATVNRAKPDLVLMGLDEGLCFEGKLRDHQMVAAGKRVHFSNKWHTFHDFLHDHLFGFRQGMGRSRTGKAA